MRIFGRNNSENKMIMLYFLYLITQCFAASTSPLENAFENLQNINGNDQCKKMVASQANNSKEFMALLQQIAQDCSALEITLRNQSLCIKSESEILEMAKNDQEKVPLLFMAVKTLTEKNMAKFKYIFFDNNGFPCSNDESTLESSIQLYSHLNHTVINDPGVENKDFEKKDIRNLCRLIITVQNSLPWLRNILMLTNTKKANISSKKDIGTILQSIDINELKGYTPSDEIDSTDGQNSKYKTASKMSFWVTCYLFRLNKLIKLFQNPKNIKNINLPKTEANLAATLNKLLGLKRYMNFLKETPLESNWIQCEIQTETGEKSSQGPKGVPKTATPPPPIPPKTPPAPPIPPKTPPTPPAPPVPPQTPPAPPKTPPTPQTPPAPPKTPPVPPQTPPTPPQTPPKTPPTPPQTPPTGNTPLPPPPGGSPPATNPPTAPPAGSSPDSGNQSPSTPQNPDTNTNTDESSGEKEMSTGKKVMIGVGIFVGIGLIGGITYYFVASK